LLSYNSRRELSAERFTGFAAFLIQCWALINNPVDNKRFKKLDIPVAILYQELLDNSKFKLGTARHFYPIFRDCAMFLPEQLLDSYTALTHTNEQHLMHGTCNFKDSKKKHKF